MRLLNEQITSGVALALAVGIVIAAHANDAAGGLVAHWSLDEPSGASITDSSPHHLNGKITEGAHRIPGVFSQAVLFSGTPSEVVSIPSSPFLKPSRQITISAWIFPLELVGYQTVYRKEDSEDRILLMFQEQGGILSLGLNAGGHYQELHAPIQAADYLDLRWHLLVGTYDGSQFRLYSDGRELDNMPASGQLITNGTAGAFIGSTSGTTEYFNGGIDDVRVYDRALGADEIKALYDEAQDIRMASSRTAENIDPIKLQRTKEIARQRQAFVRQRTALLDSWIRERQEPMNPQERARAAMEGFMIQAPERLPGSEGFYRAVFDSRLTPRAIRGHGQWDFGDCTARAVQSWLFVREMTRDQTTGAEVETGQRAFLLSMLHPETGLVYVPDRSNKQKNEYYYHIWDQSRTLRALVRWYIARTGDRSILKPYIDRMIHGLDRYATIRGSDPRWGPYAGWPSDSFINDRPGPDAQWVYVRGGLCIEPLVMFAEAAGDTAALDLAIRFANCEMGGHEADSAPPEQKPYARFEPDGSFRGHLHRVEQGRSYLLKARKSYDWMFNPAGGCGAGKCGWIPELPGVAHSETCCGADTIELAEALASCANLDPDFHDWANLHDDVESMTVNVIAATQLRFTPEFEKVLIEAYGTNATHDLPIARRFNGTWSATFFPNDLTRPDGLIVGGCCQYAGVRALYTGWHDVMSYDNGVLRINYFLNRNSDIATVFTRLPEQGEAAIRLHQEASVLVRVPEFLRADQLDFRVDGKPFGPTRTLDATGHYVALGKFPNGTLLQITFPVKERITFERMGGGGKPFTVHWRDNYVTSMKPRGNGMPLFP
ncbi:MAG: LamG domain-containing protein [Candidatus Omnitrophica bacterium]|nr:LamG domain-containing protein [Candidatus Omnitrophota bacterium]